MSDYRPSGGLDPEVQAFAVERAAEHQRAVLSGLTDDRLQLVAERLSLEAAFDAEAHARWEVVMSELRHRGLIA